jgi:hypothetical protein
MPDALISKVVDELAEIPKEIPFQLSPFKVNEPFLDVRLFDVLRLVTSKLPNATITLTTNATPIGEQTIEQLRAFANIGYLWISVNHHRAEQYEAIMQLPHARTLQRLTMLHLAKQQGRLTLRVVLSRVGDGTNADQEFCAWVRQRFPLFDACVFPRGTWLGQAGSGGAAPQPVGCVRWFELSITATGIVAHCCMDGRAEFPIGDVSKTHVLQVYNSQHYRRLREAYLNRLDVHPCQKCGFL